MVGHRPGTVVSINPVDGSEIFTPPGTWLYSTALFVGFAIIGEHGERLPMNIDPDANDAGRECALGPDFPAEREGARQ